MEEQVVANKVGKGIYVIVGVLGVIIVVLLGYIGYDKGLFGKKPVQEPQTIKKDKEEKVEKEVELTAEEISKLDEIVDKLNQGFASYYPITDMSTISNQDLLRLGSDGLYDWNTGNTFTSAQVEANVKKYFGNSVKVNHEGIKCNLGCNEPLFSYDGNGTYSYNNNHPGHGGSSGKSAYSYYVSGVKKKNTITVNYKNIYQGYPDIGPSYTLYLRYSDTTPVYTAPDPENANITKEFASQYKDQAPTTTYTFEVSEDGIYSIKKIEIK